MLSNARMSPVRVSVGRTRRISGRTSSTRRGSRNDLASGAPPPGPAPPPPQADRLKLPLPPCQHHGRLGLGQGRGSLQQVRGRGLARTVRLRSLPVGLAGRVAALDRRIERGLRGLQGDPRTVHLIGDLLGQCTERQLRLGLVLPGTGHPGRRQTAIVERYMSSQGKGQPVRRREGGPLPEVLDMGIETRKPGALLDPDHQARRLGHSLEGTDGRSMFQRPADERLGRAGWHLDGRRHRELSGRIHSAQTGQPPEGEPFQTLHLHQAPAILREPRLPPEDIGQRHLAHLVTAFGHMELCLRLLHRGRSDANGLASRQEIVERRGHPHSEVQARRQPVPPGRLGPDRRQVAGPPVAQTGEQRLGQVGVPVPVLERPDDDGLVLAHLPPEIVLIARPRAVEGKPGEQRRPGQPDVGARSPELAVRPRHRLVGGQRRPDERGQPHGVTGPRRNREHDQHRYQAHDHRTTGGHARSPFSGIVRGHPGLVSAGPSCDPFAISVPQAVPRESGADDLRARP